MSFNVTFIIDCGQTTCAKEPGKFCKYSGSRNFGSTPHCLFFREDLNIDDNGWTARCEECLNTFKVAVDTNNSA
jgi:hypothetical protein